MNKFNLCLKESGEIIHYHLATTIDEAINYFAVLKKLSSFSLLDIYDVKKIEE